MANEPAAIPGANGAPGTAAPKAGLEDIIAGQSKICFLDGKRGILAYYGYNIHDLVKGSFEETAYLLFYGKLPNKDQLSEFTAKLAEARKLPKQIQEQIVSYPKNVHPMAVIRTAVSQLSFFDQYS